MKESTKQVLKSYRGRLLASAVAGAMVVLGLGAFSLLPIAAQAPHASVPQQHTQQVQQQPVRPSTPRMIEAGAPFSFADLVERVSPSVVTITVEETVNDQSGFDPQDIPEPFRNFFNQFGQGQQSAPRRAVAMGSGFIIDKAGYIVTNNHVVEGGKKITVKLSDGREFDAKLIGTDPATDIALLKVKAGGPLPAVEFGDDRQARVGDWVIAVGNPFGLSNTVTAGIISSIGRDVGNGPYTDFIQIDAPINRGNSGGPTFDIQGKVIGMNSMIFSPSGGSVGIGFAIPSSTIHDVVAQLLAHGRVARGYLGVEIQSITPEMAASFSNKNMKGAIVASVTPSSPAAAAGFQPGDVVVAVNGKPVEDSRDLTRRVASLPAGVSAAFTVVRNGASKTLNAKIGSKKDERVASNGGSQKGGPASTAEAMGLGLAAVTPETRRAYNLDDKINGVVITHVDPNSDAADKGLQPGDVVVSVGNHPVHSPQEVKASVQAAQAAGHNTVLVLVTGQAGQRFVAIKLGA
jgi:serine protease Do